MIILTGDLWEFCGDLWQLSIVLVFLCFVTSMFITNDVALITFVPFTVMMLINCNKEDLMIPIIVLQTIAANLGSMLTPKNPKRPITKDPSNRNKKIRIISYLYLHY